MSITDTLTPAQKAIGMTDNMAEPHEAVSVQKIINDDMAADEIDFHKASIRGKVHSQDNVWDADFLEFSKWMRKTYFKDVGIAEMQKMNRNNFFLLFSALFAQVFSYWFLITYFPNSFHIWSVPLFFFCCWLVQFGEIVHTRAHWPKKMCDSEIMDTLVDSVAIIVTGTSKEGFRRRHIAAHYSDVANIARVFSDVWLPFVQFPATFYVFPHKLLKLFLDVEYCRRENLSRSQLFLEMIGLYTYLAFMIFEIVFHQSYFLLCFHMAPSMVLYGAQVMGATVAHSGIDKRNSFNSNGLFDWKECKGLFKVSLFLVDLFANGGASNHGVHHAHSQMPLHMINTHLREINAYALKNFKDVRYNQLLAHNIYGDLYASFPEPRWYDYVIQGAFTMIMIFLSALLITGLPLPPPVVFEYMLVDYRLLFLVSEADRASRRVAFWEALELIARRNLLVSPNAYLDVSYDRFVMAKEYLKTHSPTFPPPADFKARICPKDVYNYNILKPLQEAKEAKKNK